MRGNVLPQRLTRATTLGLVLLLTAIGAWSADGKHRYAIRAGKIVTVTKGVIDHGVILVSGGKIEALGPAHRVDIPGGYTVVDASDKWVMPGMVEIHSHAGTQGGINDMVSQLNPGMRIGDGVDPESEPVEAALAAGVTTLVSVPGSGTNHSGFGVAFKSAGATKEERIIRRVGIMKIAQAYNPERGGGDIGASRMGMTWILRGHLQRAKDYEDEWSEHEGGKQRDHPKRDLSLDMARPVFRGELPVLVHTYSSWGTMMTIRMFHDEFGLKAIGTHAASTGHKMAEEAAKRDFPINIGPRVVDFGGAADNRFYGMVPTYYERGAKQMSVNTDSFGFGQRYLATKAAMAARFGLDDKASLELLTINPARAILLDDRVGSIEVGKDADLIIKKTSLLDSTTPVEMVFVNGKIAYRMDAEE